MPPNSINTQEILIFNQYISAANSLANNQLEHIASYRPPAVSAAVAKHCPKRTDFLVTHCRTVILVVPNTPQSVNGQKLASNHTKKLLTLEETDQLYTL